MPPFKQIMRVRDFNFILFDCKFYVRGQNIFL